MPKLILTGETGIAVSENTYSVHPHTKQLSELVISHLTPTGAHAVHNSLVMWLSTAKCLADV